MDSRAHELDISRWPCLNHYLHRSSIQKKCKQLVKLTAPKQVMQHWTLPQHQAGTGKCNEAAADDSKAVCFTKMAKVWAQTMR